MVHTLLLADDNAAIQRVVELTLAPENIRVVAVGDGQQAIARLAGSRPDIVVAAASMPLLDGYAVASYVRNHDALRDVPVLLSVGAFDPVDEGRLRASGAAGVLVKPFEPTLVISRVKELLGRSGRPDEVPADLHHDTPVPPSRPPSEPLRTSASTPAALAGPSSVTRPADAATDAAVEQIVERVLERLASDGMRGRVDRIVHDVSERLVREEIARIRGAAGARAGSDR